MFVARILSILTCAVALCTVLSFAEGRAQAPSQTPAQDAQNKKAEADQKKAEADAAEAQRRKDDAEKNKRAVYEGNFATAALGGRTINDFNVPVQPTRLQDPDPKLEWPKPTFVDNATLCPRAAADTNYARDWPRKGEISIGSRIADRDNPNASILGIVVEAPPCWWPLTQTARISIDSHIEGVEGPKRLFNGTMPVSVLWFPLALTLLVIALVYPGCAVVAFYVKRKRYEKDCAEARKKKQPEPAKPNFWATLDPVQITANPYGRASLGKLQIFLFSLIVFGLLLFFQLRFGVLAGMSTDVLMLLGISAFGAVGGKMAYTMKRRLKLENWAWLRRKGWLPAGGDVQPRAKWSELLVDSDTKEFDPYSFQMAVFSVVVAVALIRTNLGGLGTFRIPPELLGLLGLSQVVFIGGKAVEKSGYEELDKKLDEVRERETKYLDLKHSSDPEKQAQADSGLMAFKDSVAQAREMFCAVYLPQLPDKRPAALDQVDKMQPGDSAA